MSTLLSRILIPVVVLFTLRNGYVTKVRVILIGLKQAKHYYIIVIQDRWCTLVSFFSLLEGLLNPGSRIHVLVLY